MHRPRVTLCVVAMITMTASGQSLNVDFGDGHGGPPDAYAGAGLAGAWNVLTGPVDVLTPLAGLDGGPTPVSIRVVNGFGDLADVPLAHPEIGEHEPLLGEGMLGAFGPKIPLEVELYGVEDGLYRLITYTWHWPSEAFALTAFVDQSPVVHPVGGPWPGGLVVGVTHMEHVVAVTSPPETAAVEPKIRFSIVGDGPGSFFNGSILLQGLQLWRIDVAPPCPGDLDGSGSVDVIDFLDLLAAWGPCPGCPADLDGDGEVGVIDFLALLAAWGPCPEPADCGDAGLGDCYTAHPTPGCDDPVCCAALCGFDPYCCDVAWDQQCSGWANLTAGCADRQHPNCGSAEAGDCFAASFVPGCDDAACCAEVCAMQPFCCNYQWSDFCVAQAELYCTAQRPQCGHPGAGDCFDAIAPGENVTPYCDDQSCCEAVCAVDPFCCETLWDAVCVAEANGACPGGTCGPGAGDCFAVHPAGGCADTGCCVAVCSIVPYCCEAANAWDANCVAWAQDVCAR